MTDVIISQVMGWRRACALLWNVESVCNPDWPDPFPTVTFAPFTARDPRSRCGAGQRSQIRPGQWPGAALRVHTRLDITDASVHTQASSSS